MDYKEDTNTDNLPVEQEEEFDSLEFAIRLVSWIPSTLKNLMHSDDDVDLIYLAICISFAMIAIRKKNDIKGGN